MSELITTNKPCRHGLIALRYKSSGQCTCGKCLAEYREKAARRRAADPARAKELRSINYQKNREVILLRNREARASCPERTKKWQKADYARNADKKKALAKAYRQRTPEKQRQYSTNYREKVKHTVEYKLAGAARRMMRRVLAACKADKTCSTFTALGYTLQEFKTHIEDQFHSGMTWGNYGEHWHIDHIASVSELIKCGLLDAAKINALKNIRPALAVDNVTRRDAFDLGVSIT